MATQFEFRLIGADMPEGQIDFDDAIALMQKLQELATKIGRVEVGAKHRGRPSDKVEQVAKLRLIGLLKGSTILQAERVEDKAQLDFDLDHEQGFDARFASIIEAIGGDERPADVSETIAETAADLVSVFRRIAPEMEFSAGGQVRKHFRTEVLRRETWKAAEPEPAEETVTLVGRLEAVDLKSGHFRVRDDVGFTYSLPKVADPLTAGKLIGGYVAVKGRPERDVNGRPAKVVDAVIAPHQMPAGVVVGAVPSMSLDKILASAPGPKLGGVPGLTEEEAESFFEAMGF